MRKTWLRPIVTAVLFPIVLTGSMWALDEFSGEERLPWTKTNLSATGVAQLAEAECFRHYPGYEKYRPWHTKYAEHHWLIRGTRSGLPWVISSRFDSLMVAVIDDTNGVFAYCGAFDGR